MRNLLLILSAVLMLSCQMPVEVVTSKLYESTPTDTPYSYPGDSHNQGKPVIKNALWETVPLSVVSRAIGRSVDGDGVEEAVEEYNAETLDDFLRVYYETAPDLANAPPVTVYIVNPQTWHRNMELVGIPRIQLVENVAGWRHAAHGQILYIDHVPPQPIVTPPPSMYAHYALYVVDGDGDIVFEDHCGWTVAEVWDGQWILDGGWTNADDYWYDRRSAFIFEANTHPGWQLIERRLYEAPL